jgi:hypothetical protein
MMRWAMLKKSGLLTLARMLAEQTEMSVSHREPLLQKARYHGLQSILKQRAALRISQALLRSRSEERDYCDEVGCRGA